MKEREHSWAATEARLKAGKEDVTVDAARIRESLKLTQLDHQKQLAKVEEEKRNLDELLQKKRIKLETIGTKFEANLQAKEVGIQTKEANLEVKQMELSRTLQNFDERSEEVSQTKERLQTARANLRNEEQQL